MKRKPLLAALAIVLLLVVVQSTLAYFTSKDEKKNVFTMGNVDITLTEPNWNETEEHVFTPGAKYEKDPMVENTGSMDAYIRVHVTLSDYSALTEEMPKDYDLTQIFDEIDSSKWTSTGEGVVKDDTITYSYYYNTVLSPNESTGALFTKVLVPTFITEKTNGLLGEDFTITVFADAIQSESFNGPEEAFAAFDAQKNQ